MSKTDGGAAFPFTEWRSPDGMIAYGSDKGMTLRDWFAGQALAGWMSVHPSDQPDPHPDHLAVGCYQLADAMLKAREA